MTITELSLSRLLGTPTNYLPFIFQYKITDYIVASYWIITFGAPDESQSAKIQLNDVTRDYTTKYQRLTNLAAVISTKQSFYFDPAIQTLYVHIEHDQAPWTCTMGYGEAFGYSTKFSGTFDGYINDIFYAPLITSIPNLSQQQELINYDKLSLINGSITLNNVKGLLDIFIDEKIYNNTIDIYHLDDSIEDIERSDLQQIGQFLIDAYDISLKEMDIRIQDKRTEGDADIPTAEFTIDDYPDMDPDLIGDIIPVGYGPIRVSEAIPTDGESTGTISFRQALILTTLGTVQVKIDDVWTTKATTATDLSTGSFTLAQADGRKDGDADGDPYECRVLDSVGTINVYASDVIKYLNYTYLGIEYNSSNYDTTEWEEEETSLETIGVLFNEQIELSEAIRQVQDGANIGFRYEVNAEGLRTIRLNNWDRQTRYRITFPEINNNGSIKVTSDKEYLAANLKVKYAQDYHSNKFRSFKNTDYAEYVLENYKTTNIIPVEKLLTTEAHASDFSDWYLNKFSDVPRIVSLELLGTNYFDVRIYDILIADISTVPLDIEENEPERLFFGKWKMIVLSIDPLLNTYQNNITALLIEKQSTDITIMISESEKIMIGESGNIMINEN